MATNTVNGVLVCSDGTNVPLKAEIAEAISALLEPMQERRAQYDGDDDTIIDILRDGTARANVVAEETLSMAKEAAGLGFFRRSLCLK